VSRDEPKQGPGFTIVDRRGGRDEEPDAPSATPSLPPADFAALVLSFASSALLHLGLLEDPQTGRPTEKSLPLARHSIDLLELLEAKTRGNLSPDEAALITNLLTELRVRFVECSRSG
jgi:hypothetical protein